LEEQKLYYFFTPRIRYEPVGLEGWKKIFMAKKPKVLSKKSILVNQGEQLDYLYFIISGLIEYTHTCADGTQEVLEILGDGNIFGLQPIFNDKIAIGSFVTLEESIISYITIEELNSYIDHDINLAKELLRESSQIANGLINQLFSQTTRAEHRIQQMLCTLADYEKNRKSFEGAIVISFSQDELARITRTTRVTVTKFLAELKKQNLIKTEYGRVIINDLNELKKMV
jgi:CRP-like cAMP-binding protein